MGTGIQLTNPHPRTRLLTDDVNAVITAGQRLILTPVNRVAEVRRALTAVIEANRLDPRDAIEYGVTTTSLATTAGLALFAAGGAVLTAEFILPVALAVGGKVAVKSVGWGWDWASNRWSASVISGATPSEKAIVLGDGSLNPEYGKTLLANVANQLKREKLEKVKSAFADLEPIFISLRDKLMITGSGRATQVTLKLNQLRTCDQAARLWEEMGWVFRHLETVGALGDDLVDFVTYVTLVISQFTVQRDHLYRKLWKVITNKYRRRARDVLDTLNRAVSKGNIQMGYVGWAYSYFRTADYRTWAYSQLPEELTDPARQPGGANSPAARMAMALRVEIAMKVNPALVRQQIGRHFQAHVRDAQALNEAVGGRHNREEQLASVGLEYLQCLNVIEQPVDFSANLASSFVEEFFKKEGKSNFALIVNALDFTKLADFEISATDFQGWLEPLVGMAAKQWAKKQVEKRLETRKFTDSSGQERDLTVSEIVQLLTPDAQEGFAKYVELMQDWEKGFQLAQTAASPDQAALALLLCTASEKAYYSSPVGQILQEMALAIGQFRTVMLKAEAEVGKEIDKFIRNHPDKVCDGTGCCYGSLYRALVESGYSNKISQQNRAAWGNQACHRLGQPDAYTAIGKQLANTRVLNPNPQQQNRGKKGKKRRP